MFSRPVWGLIKSRAGHQAVDPGARSTVRGSAIRSRAIVVLASVLSMLPAVSHLQASPTAHSLQSKQES